MVNYTHGVDINYIVFMGPGAGSQQVCPEGAALDLEHRSGVRGWAGFWYILRVKLKWLEDLELGLRKLRAEATGRMQPLSMGSGYRRMGPRGRCGRSRSVEPWLRGQTRRDGHREAGHLLCSLHLGWGWGLGP